MDERSPDVLEILARDDKWYLGGAPALLYAPPFPVWLDTPGFADRTHFLHFALEPLFTLTLVDERGREVPLRAERRRWRPDRLEIEYRAPGLAVRELRCVGPADAASCVLELRALGSVPAALRVVAWTAQPVRDETLRGAELTGGGARLRREVEGLRGSRRDLSLALGMQEARSASIELSEATANQPHYALTPFRESLGRDGLAKRVALTGVNRNGLLYAAVERPVRVAPGETVRVIAAAGVGLSDAGADAALAEALAGDPVAASTAAWRAYFAALPRFSSGDERLDTAWWYRWYGLRLNTIAPAAGNYRHPAVAEGIDYFRVPIAYSAPCHMLETRWMADGTLAWGSLLTFLDNQRADGSLPNHVHLDHVAPSGIYHADWGTRVLDVYRVHPDREALARAYEGLTRYAGHFYRERDAQGSHLYDHVNQWESGQEYMSRYVWVDDTADEWKPMKRRLKGIDASVYVYALERALAEMSRILGRGEEAAWDERADATRDAIRRLAWNPEIEAFVDCDPDLRRSQLVFALSFYPFATDIAEERHLVSIRRHLLDPDVFWTPFPVPASPLTDPEFSAAPAWRGKRTNCPWNGRTWPMTNSHVVEALARASGLDPSLRESTAHLISRFVAMMAFDGDPKRPNSFEHYNPLTGTPSAYRGIDDYMHSWVNDLLVKYVVGLRPDAEGALVDPFPFGLERVALSGVHLRGHIVDVEVVRGAARVSVDGREVALEPSPDGPRLRLASAVPAG